MRKFHLLPAALLLATAPLAAQMSGIYVIDTQGAGQFATFTAAVNAMFAGGINGDVELIVLPGTYTESVIVPPIAGADTFRIAFRAATGPGTVQLGGGPGNTFTFLAVGFQQLNGIVLDGIDFTGAPGHAISATTFCSDFELVRCTFADGHRSNQPGEFRHALIVCEDSGNDTGWHVHECNFTVPSHTSRTSYGMYISNGGLWNIHDNVFDLNSCDYGLYLINSNRRLDRIWNNQFIGSLRSSTSTSANSTAAIKADVSNYDNDIVHNTFHVTIPGTGCCIAAGGISSSSNPATNRIHGNVFYLPALGTCVCYGSSAPMVADGNLYFCPAGEIARIGPQTPGDPLLATWQATSGVDLLSAQADPLFVSPIAPLDLRLQTGSPAKDLAVLTPAYVTTDFAGRLRDAQPDAGAFESTSFAVFGAGCGPAAGLPPAMGSVGQLAIGSTSFAFTVTQAAPTSLALLVGGASRQASGSIPLPFDLGGGCQLLVSPDAARSAVTNAVGDASLPLIIPNQPALIGVNMYFQWVVIDPASPSAFGVTVSEGAAMQM